MAVAGSLRWAVEHAERLRPLLTSVPPAGRGVCARCHGRTRPEFPLCFPCRQIGLQVAHPCLTVVPVSLYRARSGLHSVLRLYKEGPDPARRRHFGDLVAGALARFLWEHGPCVAPDGWDRLVVVPSTRGRSGPDRKSVV